MKAINVFKAKACSPLGILIVLFVTVTIAVHAQNGEVETLSPSDITATSAVCGGRVKSNFTVGQILERGICYAKKGTEAATTLDRNDSKIVYKGTVSKEFNGLKIEGLKKNTTYQVRAYIIGSDGSSYGNIKELITLERNDTPIGEGIGNPTATTDPGVVINGVRWATRNVDTPGTFAATSESPGKLYKWNSKNAWPSTGLIDHWDTNSSTASKWLPENDPCPCGWRLPYLTEIAKLKAATWKTNDNDKFIGVYIGTSDFGKDRSERIFLPYVQFRQKSDGVLIWPKISDWGEPKALIYLLTADGRCVEFRIANVDNKYNKIKVEWKFTSFSRWFGAYPLRCVKK